MLRGLLALLRPLPQIATELRIMRELYEAELAERGIFRITEKSSYKNTEVSYSGVEDKRKSHKLWDTMSEQDEEAD